MESKGVAEDLSMKAAEGEEADSSDGEDPETSSGVGGADQLVGYIICFASMVNCMRGNNLNCFGCGSSDHLVKDCLRDLSKITQKASLNVKEGKMKKGDQAPLKPVVAQLASLVEAPRA